MHPSTHFKTHSSYLTSFPLHTNVTPPWQGQLQADTMLLKPIMQKGKGTAVYDWSNVTWPESGHVTPTPHIQAKPRDAGQHGKKNTEIWGLGCVGRGGGWWGSVCPEADTGKISFCLPRWSFHITANPTLPPDITLCLSSEDTNKGNACYSMRDLLSINNFPSQVLLNNCIIKYNYPLSN